MALPRPSRNDTNPIVSEELARVVADGNILRLVEKFLRAGVLEDGMV
jgi:hypothetical protein